MICVKICQEPSQEIFNKLKQDLSTKSIHLYKMVRVTNKFLGHKAARSRIYKYSVPTYFLKECDFEEEYLKRESEDRLGSSKRMKHIKSKDNESENQRELNESENQRELNESENQRELNESENQRELNESENQRELNERENMEQESSEKENNKRMREYKMEELEDLINYKSSAEDIAAFSRFMKMYEGTNNYHNFTIKSNAKGSSRFIKSVQISEPFIKDQVQYVEVTLHGQSFLIHQIRKMISFALLNCRYSREKGEQNMKKALSKEYVHVPKSPSEYLFLNHVFFDDYNLKADELHGKIDVNEEEKKEIENSLIYPSVFQKKNLLEWLKYLDCVRFHHYNFDLLKK
jgi:tRNA pseudouridine(38-40) synthase